MPAVHFDLMLLKLLAIVPAFTLHELGHALTADRLGDPTPRWQGRITLNPLKHVDWIGLLLLLTVGFGWAKPVEVNARNFRDPRWGMFLVTIAGPAANLLLALAGAIGYFLGGGQLVFWAVFVQINIILFVFNLLPVPPLDGSHLMATLFPRSIFNSPEARQYGWVILMLLLVTGLLDKPLWLVTRSLEGVVMAFGRAVALALPIGGGL